MNKKKNLNLSDLKIKSFISATNKDTQDVLRGGTFGACLTRTCSPASGETWCLDECP